MIVIIIINIKRSYGERQTDEESITWRGSDRFDLSASRLLTNTFSLYCYHRLRLSLTHKQVPQQSQVYVASKDVMNGIRQQQPQRQREKKLFIRSSSNHPDRES